MTNINDLSNEQILKVIAIRKKIEKLQSAAQKRVWKLQGKIDAIAGDSAAVATTGTTTKRKKRRMSRAGRAAIAAAAKARWAKYRGKGASVAKKPAAGKKRAKFSAAARAKLAASAPGALGEGEAGWQDDVVNRLATLAPPILLATFVPGCDHPAHRASHGRSTLR